ncbi:N-acetylmuramoyl-L-alanine amidase [Staphylococcus aureus]
MLKAILKYKSLEKDYTLKTAKELQRTLEKEGATVNDKNRRYICFTQNRDIKGDAYLSIHNDALESSNVNGMIYSCQ